MDTRQWTSHTGILILTERDYVRCGTNITVVRTAMDTLSGSRGSVLAFFKLSSSVLGTFSSYATVIIRTCSASTTLSPSRWQEYR